MALSFKSRLALAGLAFAGSAAYAASFISAAERRWMMAMACVGIAAGLSWIIFGLILLATTRRRISAWQWVDTCLLAMAVGIAIKLGGVAMNLLSRQTPWLAGHIAILLIADVAMGALFVMRARRLAVGAGQAVGYWLTLNAIFAILLLALLNIAGVLR
jgi:uncharacterized membrane protein SirB2